MKACQAARWLLLSGPRGPMARNHCVTCGKHGHNSVRCDEKKLIGQTFEEWLVTGQIPDVRRKPTFSCRCRDCGEEREILKEKLTGGRSPKSKCRRFS